MMNESSIFIIVCILLLGCQNSATPNQKSISDESNTKSLESDSTKFDPSSENTKLDIKDLKDELSQVATSFHTWYIGVRNNDKSDTPLWAEIAKDTDGM